MELCFRGLILATILFGTSAAFAADSFNFEHLAEKIEKKEVRSIEELLASLPLEMRKNFNIIVESRSTQQYVDRENPRVLLANGDRSLVIAFNGKMGTKGFTGVEVMHVDPKTEEFKFKLIDFSNPNSPITEPTICNSCHHGKPIWDTYPNWAGLLGESGTTLKQRRSVEERQLLKDFREKAKTDPRYRHLSFEEDYIEQVITNNEEMSNAFSRLNFKRIHRKVRAHPRWQEITSIFRDIVNDRALTYGERAEAAAEIYLSALREKGVNVNRDLYREKLIKIRSKIFTYGESVKKRMRFAPELTPSTFNNDQAPVAALLELITDELGVDGPSTWSMTFERQSYSFSSPAAGLMDFRLTVGRPPALSCPDWLY